MIADPSFWTFIADNSETKHTKAYKMLHFYLFQSRGILIFESTFHRKNRFMCFSFFFALKCEFTSMIKAVQTDIQPK